MEFAAECLSVLCSYVSSCSVTSLHFLATSTAILNHFWVQYFPELQGRGVLVCKAWIFSIYNWKTIPKKCYFSWIRVKQREIYLCIKKTYSLHKYALFLISIATEIWFAVHIENFCSWLPVFLSSTQFNDLHINDLGGNWNFRVFSSQPPMTISSAPSQPSVLLDVHWMF